MKRTIYALVSRILLVAMLAVTAAGFSAIGCSAAAADVAPPSSTQKKDGQVTMSTKDGLSVTIEYGFSRYGKYGRNLPVRAVVENQGNDFEGELQILVPRQNGDNNMFGREISVASGETKVIELPIFLDFIGKTIYARMVKDDKELVGVKMPLSVKGETSLAFAGVLSEQPEEIGFLGDKKSFQTFDLSVKSFPENVKMLDCLDVIVMDNFESSQLSDKQYAVLKSWVENGGSLVIGTGSNVKKVFSLFQDDFITGSIGEGEQNTADININGAYMVTDNVVPYQRVSKGLGNIMIFDKPLPEYNTTQIKAGLISEIYEGLSETKKTQLQSEAVTDYDFYNYSARNAISIMSKGVLPKVSDYSLVLILYCIAAGPILYIIFKKWDKRNFLWLAVPVTALVFSGIIYLIGGKTRITKPLANYMTVSTITGMNTDKPTAVNKTTFGILTAKNQKYEFNVAADRNLSMYSDENEYYYDDEMTNKSRDFKSYQTGLTFGADVCKLTLNHKDVFSWTYFQDESVSQETGSVVFDLTSDNFKTSGSITNNLGYNLENVTVYAGRELYFIGDLTDGGTVQIPSKQSQHIYNADSLYDTDDVFTNMVGGDYYAMDSRNKDYVDVSRKYNALQSYFNGNTWITGGGFLVGFTKEFNQEGSVLSELGLEGQGLRMVVIPLEDLSQTYQNAKMEETIDPYLVGSLSDIGVSSNSYRYMSTSLNAVYQFEKDNLPDKLAYLSGTNPEFDKKYSHYAAFYGTIYAVDENGEKHLLFESGKEKAVGIRKYIDADGKLKLYYEQDTTQLQNHDIMLPYLSAIWEVK